MTQAAVRKVEQQLAYAEEVTFASIRRLADSALHDLGRIEPRLAAPPKDTEALEDLRWVSACLRMIIAYVAALEGDYGMAFAGADDVAVRPTG
jgi:hypothetical protein